MNLTLVLVDICIVLTSFPQSNYGHNELRR